MRRANLAATSLVLAIGLLLGGLIGFGPHQKVHGTTASASYCATPEDIAILNDVNQHREENGVPPLTLVTTLGEAADYHSQDMATNNHFDHVLYDGTGWSQNIRNFGYDQNTWRGENIAAGNSDPHATYLQWLNSPGHNANMLSPNFTAIGIGHADVPSSQWGNYWTQTFGGYVDTPAVACDGSDPNAQWAGDIPPSPLPSAADPSRAPRGSDIPASLQSPPVRPSYKPVRVPRPTSASRPTAQPTARPTYKPVRTPRPRTQTSDTQPSAPTAQPTARPTYKPVRIPRPTTPPSAMMTTNSSTGSTTVSAQDTESATPPVTSDQPTVPDPAATSGDTPPDAPVASTAAVPAPNGVQSVDPQRPAR